MSNWGEAYLEIVRIPGATNLLGNSNLTLQELRDVPRSMSQGLESPTRISFPTIYLFASFSSALPTSI